MSQYSSIKANDAKELRSLKDENAPLKRVFAGRSSC